MKSERVKKDECKLKEVTKMSLYIAGEGSERLPFMFH